MATYLSERLPIVIAANPGERFSLTSVLDQAFGPGWSFDPGLSVYARSTDSQSYTRDGVFVSFGHWNNGPKTDGYFLVDGKPVPLDESRIIDKYSSVELVAGNSLTPLMQFAVHNAFAPGKESVFTWYTISVVPRATSTPGDYTPTGAEIAAKALEFASVYKDCSLPLDCGWISEVIAASAGAPMPVYHYSIVPSENEEGGLWRIVHRGDQNPVKDWQKLVQPGDIIRLKWDGALYHTTLVIEGEDAQGRITVVDNSGPILAPNLRKADFEKDSFPNSITIYRIASDGQYLLEGSGSGEKLNGTERSDRINALAGNDEIRASGGDDVIVPGAGNDAVNGGAGRDTILVNSSRAAATIGAGGSSVTGPDGSDSLVSVERVHFTDAIVAFDGAGTMGQAYRLYQAAFARVPDKGGLSFWVDRFDDGAALRDVALGFTNSAEFRSAYGSQATPETYVQKFYQNVLGRAGEASGVAYWSGELKRGVSLADVLVGFSESPENVNKLAPLIGQGVELDLGFFV